MKIRFLCGERFSGFAQVRLTVATITIPAEELPANRVLLSLGVGKIRRDAPRCACGSLQEVILVIVAHELWHLMCAEYRGTLGSIDAPDPDVMELTPELVMAIGTWDLDKLHHGRQSVEDFSEELAADTYALQRPPSLAPARGSAKRPSLPTVLGESEKPLLVLRRRGAVIL